MMGPADTDHEPDDGEPLDAPHMRGCRCAGCRPDLLPAPPIAPLAQLGDRVRVLVGQHRRREGVVRTAPAADHVLVRLDATASSAGSVERIAHLALEVLAAAAPVFALQEAS